MKVYFIFDIKDEFVNLYKGNESVLYNILKQIYFLDRNEILYGYNLFKQLTIPINKELIDREIYIKFHRDIPYSKRGETHYINNLYRDEVSRLLVKTSYIRLELDQKKTTFFEILKRYSKNYFVCCFDKCECFFLSDEETRFMNKMLVCNHLI